MKEYDVYFEIFGKKLKTTILAKSIDDAKQKIIAKIKWHKIIEKPNDEINRNKDTFENLMNIFGMNK